MEIDSEIMKQVINILKQMYDMSECEDWRDWKAQDLIIEGADIYADYFRNNN